MSPPSRPRPPLSLLTGSLSPQLRAVPLLWPLPRFRYRYRGLLVLKQKEPPLATTDPWRLQPAYSHHPHIHRGVPHGCAPGPLSLSASLPPIRQNPSLPGLAPQTLPKHASHKSRRGLPGSLLRLSSVSTLPLVSLACPQLPLGLPSHPSRGAGPGSRQESRGGGAVCGSISGLSGPSGLLCWSSVSSYPRLGQKSLVRRPPEVTPRHPSLSFSALGLPPCLASGPPPS